MPIKLLHHKSWHVYNQENVARVKRDEAKARGEEEESDRRSMLAESEARLDRMRKKKKRDRDGQGAGEKALERQLKGLPPAGSSKDREEEDQQGGTMIVRPDNWKGTGKGKEREKEEAIGPDVMPEVVGRHINFWSELEAGAAKPTAQQVAKLDKAVEEQKKLEELTKMYLAKKGEGDVRGWYAREDFKTERELKEGVEETLERVYKDTENKRLSDPLAMMNAFLKRRSDVLSGTAPSSSSSSSSSRFRERYPTPASERGRGDLSPVITSLLSKRRRGEMPPPPPPTSERGMARKDDTSSASFEGRRSVDAREEADSRVESERARAARLIRERKRKREEEEGRSLASETPRSSVASEAAGWGMYNRSETKEAREARERRTSGWAQSHSTSWAPSSGHSSRRDRDDRGGGGGWADQKRRREERDRWKR
ncbi:hypothetical protein T439DRAFT_379265 [Meredithblackwellia eburnea MCA 4105]